MNGTISTYSRHLGGGLIRADNGDWHRFVDDDVINPQHDLVGQSVDFVAGEQGAVEVVVFCGAPWQACTCRYHDLPETTARKVNPAPCHQSNEASRPDAATQWPPQMEPMAAVMQALSSPDEYVFEWRDGELFIEPKAAVPVAKVHVSNVIGSKVPVSKVRKALSALHPMELSPRQPDYASA